MIDCYEAVSAGKDFGIHVHRNNGRDVGNLVFNVVNPREYAWVSDHDLEMLIKIDWWQDVVTYLGGDAIIR